MVKVLRFVVIASGIASQYAPGVMERVIEYRQSLGQLSEDLTGFDGAVAVLNCKDIGKTIYLKPKGGQWEKFIVADCAGKADGGYNWMLRHNILVEIDGKTAERWKTKYRGIWIYQGKPVYKRWYEFR